VTLAARCAARSDIGRLRQTNEDAYLVRAPLFAVADGMGGAQAGEVASRIALETLVELVPVPLPDDPQTAADALAAAVAAANSRIHELATSQVSRAGMGTTLTALQLAGHTAQLAHIGDSRAYLCRRGDLEQISEDHSLVAEMVREGYLTSEQAAAHPHRSILSRALGTEPSAAVDLRAVDVQPGDVLLLCSDGLTSAVEDGRLAELLAVGEPAEVVDALVGEALANGGPDNITAVVVRVVEAAEGPEQQEEAGSAAAAELGGAASPTAGADDPGLSGGRRQRPRRWLWKLVAAAWVTP
jgi:protein phosphatase